MGKCRFEFRLGLGRYRGTSGGSTHQGQGLAAIKGHVVSPSRKVFGGRGLA
jgi:hypothetical protein